MSSKQRRNETKQLRDSYSTKTLKELEDEGLVTEMRYQNQFMKGLKILIGLKK